MMLDTIASMTDTAEVTAAKITIKKKRIPTTGPAFPMAAKTLGRETNIKPGPALIPSFPIKVNTAGTIIKPARRATTVSKISI